MNYYNKYLKYKTKYINAHDDMNNPKFISEELRQIKIEREREREKGEKGEKGEKRKKKTKEEKKEEQKRKKEEREIEREKEQREREKEQREKRIQKIRETEKKDRKKNYLNLINLLKSNCTQVDGPSRICLYKINNKYVLLFSDIHKKITETCEGKNNDAKINITNLLDTLFLNTPYCIDFFLETYNFMEITKHNRKNERARKIYNDYLNKIDKSDDIVIESLFSKFVDCLHVNKSNCNYPRVRFHNIEYRRFIQYKYNINWSHIDFGVDDYDDDFNKIDSIFTLPTFFFKHFYTSKDFDLIFSDFIGKIDLYLIIYEHIFLTGDLSELSDAIISLFGGIYMKVYNTGIHYDFNPVSLHENSPYHKIFNQYKSINKLINESINKVIKKRIYNYYFKQINEIIENIKKHYESIEITAEIYKKLFISLYKLNISFSVAIMDTYAIGRLFKSVYLYDSSLTVLYAGGVHISNYTNIFDNLNKLLKIKKIVDIKNKLDGQPNRIDNCVEINDENESEWMKLVTVLEELGELSSQKCNVNRNDITH